MAKTKTLKVVLFSICKKFDKVLINEKLDSLIP